MKKILLATTLLAASTGFAAAEVAVSGTARMGIVYDGTDFAYSSRVRVKFDLTGETDGGLAFGASVRNDQFSGNGAVTVDQTDPGLDGILGTADDILGTQTLGSTGTTNGDSTVFISGAFGKLTMGDVSGAGDKLVGQTSGVGYGPNDGAHEIGFLGNQKTAAYYEYSTGALTFGLGAGQVGSDDFSVGAKYSADTFAVAIAFEDDGVETQTSILGSVTFGAATVKAKAVDNSAAVDTAFSVSVDYVIDALKVTAVYTDFGPTDIIGLGAAYDLGGGAAVKAGILDDGIDTIGDVGLTFTF